MIFGFNTDVPAKEGIYHVQTEDRGAKNPVIESVIYVGGKIMGRKRTPYVFGEVPRERVEEMVRRQHKDVVEAIRAGTWLPDGGSSQAAASAALGYAIRLLNPEDVRHGEFLRFRFAVRERGASLPVAGVAMEVRWLLGGAVAESQSLVTQADGGAELWLPRPPELLYGTLLVCVHGPAGREIVKFHVRGSTAG